MSHFANIFIFNFYFFRLAHEKVPMTNFWPTFVRKMAKLTIADMPSMTLNSWFNLLEQRLLTGNLIIFFTKQSWNCWIFLSQCGKMKKNYFRQTEIRQINYLVLNFFSRNVCQKSVGVNFRFYHNVRVSITHVLCEIKVSKEMRGSKLLF